MPASDSRRRISPPRKQEEEDPAASLMTSRNQMASTGKRDQAKGKGASVLLIILALIAIVVVILIAKGLYGGMISPALDQAPKSPVTHFSPTPASPAKPAIWQPTFAPLSHMDKPILT